MKKGKVSFEVLQRQKRRARARDAKRLAEGTVTPDQLQTENSFITEGTSIRILNLAATLKKHYAK